MKGEMKGYTLNDKYESVQPEQTLLVEEHLTPTLVATKLALKRHQHIGAKGDLLAFLTEIELYGKNEPCLVIANRRAPRERHVYIPLTHLWQYIEPNSMRRIAPGLCEHLYGFATKQDFFRVIDAVYEFAEDLQKAPPPSWIGIDQWLKALDADGWVFHNNGRPIYGHDDMTRQ